MLSDGIDLALGSYTRLVSEKEDPLGETRRRADRRHRGHASSALTGFALGIAEAVEEGRDLWAVAPQHLRAGPGCAPGPAILAPIRGSWWSSS